ncbi:MAG: ExeA family protein [Nitrospinota bacterium]
MYLEYWGLKEPPFENVPNPKFLYYSSKHEEAMTRLLYAAHSHKGASMLTGEVGSGKTILSRAFIQELPRAKFEVALITNPCLSPVELIREIIYQLGIPQNDKADKVELLRILNDQMLKNLQADKDTVLIIDEAQAIEEDSTFEEIRLLLNFQLNDRFLLTLFLIGQPELKAKVERIPQLSQRISIKYHLTPLNYKETVQFIFFRLKTAGLQKSVFSEEALKLIYEHSGGIPRNIVNLCDLCLLVGFSYKAPLVNSKLVAKVIEDSEGG